MFLDAQERARRKLDPYLLPPCWLTMLLYRIWANHATVPQMLGFTAQKPEDCTEDEVFKDGKCTVSPKPQTFCREEDT